ncbi:MAG: V-type ATPase subunit [Treponema sp.]|nr:V-type ATPase subunit [Treponema sp.]
MLNDDGYAYAKASWIIGKSFLGKRFNQLSGLHTLSELDRLVFPDSYRELPGRELLVDLERRIEQRAIRQILSIVKSYTHPHKLLVRMIKGYEHSDLKKCFTHISCGKYDVPALSDIGRFRNIRFDLYPDFPAMLKKTEYENLLGEDIKHIKQGMDLTAIETKLDFYYYQGLIEGLSQLFIEEDRHAAARLITDEIRLRNCLWALRLRTYYNKSESEIKKYLLDFKLNRNIYQRSESLSAEAKTSLDFHLDLRKNWAGWRWEKFLNPSEGTLDWKVDPRHFQNAASQYLYHHVYHNFHSSPVSVSAIYCFIKLKQFEEDMLTSIAEGLALGMDSSGVFKMLEVA